jgi:cardiolipin synthase
MLAWLGHIPIWLVVTIIARDIIIVMGSFSYYLLFGRYEMRPSWISKINTVAQIFMILLVVTSLSVFEVNAIVITIFVYIVFSTTVLSGLDYVITWGVKAWRNRLNRY